MSILKIIVIALEVLLLFNLLIFVHELGHFLAARWRGLKIDRFAIWFGKPIWKKKIGGVEYALGTIPAGGYVSLPQMATMEVIEGKGEPETGGAARSDPLFRGRDDDAPRLRKKGEIDLAYKTLNPSDIKDLSAKKDITLNKLPGPQIRYLCFETSKSVFKEKALRQAVGALVDRPDNPEGLLRSELAALLDGSERHGLPYRRFQDHLGRRKCGSGDEPPGEGRVRREEALPGRALVYPEPLRRFRGQYGQGPQIAVREVSGGEGYPEECRMGYVQG